MLSRTVLVALSMVLASAGILAAQEHQPAKAASDQPSAAGTKRYANMPKEAVPFRKFSKPYKEWFVEEKTLDYNGAARDRIVEEIENSKTVNVGFLGPQADRLQLLGRGIGGGLRCGDVALELSVEVLDLLLDRTDGLLGAADVARLLHRAAGAAGRGRGLPDRR